MGTHRQAGRLGASRLDEGDGLAGGARPLGRQGKARCIAYTLQVQAEGRDARVLRQQLDEVLGGQARLVADGEHIADRQRWIHAIRP